MHDFSIDLETLGTRYNAAVISIGVVQFDRSSGQIGETFYREIDFDSAVRAGKANGSTIAWWVSQTEKAKRIFTGKNKVALAVALDDLRSWMTKLSRDPLVWGNGATFDITILEHAYENGAVGLKEPWAFWNVRDMRTAVDMAGCEKADDLGIQREGVHHNALDDAIHQAQCIAACYRRIVSLSSKPSVQTKAAKKPVVTEDDEL